MTETQALRIARKRWGKSAFVRCKPAGAFIGQDHKWRENLTLCCSHGRRGHRLPEGHKCVAPLDYYIVSRDPLVLAKPRIRDVALYEVGRIHNLVMTFAVILGAGESWKVALENSATKTF